MVDGHHDRHAVALDVLDLFDEVAGAGPQRIEVFGEQPRIERLAGDNPVASAVRLERADGGDQHRGVRSQTARAAFDVEEFLGAEISAKARLRNEHVGHAQADLVGDDRGVAVRDVAERPCVHQRGGVFERLHQVRLNGVPHDDRHGAGHANLLGGDRARARGPARRRCARAAPADRAGWWSMRGSP